MKRESLVIILSAAGLISILLGIVAMFGWLYLGVSLIVIGIVLLFFAWRADKNGKVEWRAVAALDPVVQRRVVDKAREFAGIRLVQNVAYPRVNSSHTRFVNVLGIDSEGFQVLAGIDPKTLEPVKMAKLCPRQEEEATEVHITESEAMTSCMSFLKSKGLSIPEGYQLEEAKTVSFGPWKRWRFVWRHQEEDVNLLPDFVLIEVNATEKANVITYSKVHHSIEVDTSPSISLKEAEANARKSIRMVDGMELEDKTLSVVYPNNFFKKQIWEWSDKQALCWILKFGKEQKQAIDVWVDAMSGVIQGGIFYHLHAPAVRGIDRPAEAHMGSHLQNIWKPYFELMKFDTGAMLYANDASGISESNFANAIANARYFIVEAHGGLTTTAEDIAIAYSGSTDARSFTPDEVPANNLRLAFLDTCYSGEDGTGLDFKDTFITQGTNVFIGFDASMCAWSYENSLLHYLSQGLHLANAHNLAVADVSPTYPIVITYDVPCLNKVRLAPVITTVITPSAPVAQGTTFTVKASINNFEDVDHTAANNVQAQLVLPSGFTITSGANPQNLGSINWKSPKEAIWNVKAPITKGTYSLDVEAWSDNLGAAVNDPADPFHKFEVEVTSIWYGMIAKIFKAFDWLRRIIVQPPDPRRYGFGS